MRPSKERFRSGATPSVSRKPAAALLLSIDLPGCLTGQGLNVKNGAFKPRDDAVSGRPN
jgi:hypothetical protein